MGLFHDINMAPKKPDADTKKAPAKKPVPKKAAEKKADGAGDDKSKDKAGAPAKHVRKAQKKVVKGTHGTRVKKVRTTVHFRRPKTFRPARNPKYPRKSVASRNRMDAHNIIKH